MKISKTHQRFADYLHDLHDVLDQYVLEHPGDYLGPNWEEVINFWLYLDTLSENQLLVVNKRYWDLSYEERNVAYGRVSNVARDTTKDAEYAEYAGDSAYHTTILATAHATYELIGLQKLLEQGHQPVFFPMFLNP
jgi:hypothetical protein